MISQELTQLNIPKQSGVYFFRKGKKILYIGKATSLADRSKSYFGKDIIKTRGPHIVDMVFKADTLTWQETDSALEALILEASLIRKYQPYYNTKDKDGKSYLCICITNDEWPMVVAERQKNINPKDYQFVFGPFTQGTAVREALQIIRKIFPFIDPQSQQKNNRQFYEQLGLSPTQAKEAHEEYLKNIEHIILFLKGKKKEIVRALKKDMMRYAKELRFEDAGRVKRKLFALEHINDVALLKKNIWNNEHATGVFRLEAYDVAHLSGKQMVGVMVVFDNGTANKNDYRKFIIRGFNTSNDTGALNEVLMRRLRHTEWGIPDAIVVDGSTGQINAARRALDSYRMKIPILAVTKDERHKARSITGDENIIKAWGDAIVSANAEAHRFAISFHKLRRSKDFLS